MAYGQSLVRPDYYSALEIPTSVKFNSWVSSNRNIVDYAEQHQHTGFVDGSVLFKFGDQLGDIFVYGRDQQLGIGTNDPYALIHVKRTVAGEVLRVTGNTGDRDFSVYLDANAVYAG